MWSVGSDRCRRIGERSRVLGTDLVRSIIESKLVWRFTRVRLDQPRSPMPPRLICR